MHSLKRHQRTIPVDEMTIVINTQDEDFKESAIAHCTANSIEYVVTESNGTASRGKNSVYDLFRASSYDYAVLIDGDDFITPHGVWAYKQIAQHSDEIDVLALEYQFGIWRENGYDELLAITNPIVPGVSDPFLGCNDRANPEKIHGHGVRCFLHTYDWWQRAINGTLIAKRNDWSNDLSDTHKHWATHCYKYLSKWETHHRLVMFSKNAVSGYSYDPDFVVGEDTLLYLVYKDAHVRGNLKLRHLYDRYPTYVYDTRVPGVVEENKNIENDRGDEVGDYGWYLWMKKLAEEYDVYEAAGKLHLDTVMPRIEVDFPEGYTPDVLGLVNYPGIQNIRYL